MSNVYLKECREYDYFKIKDILLDSFKELGGIEKYISRGESVFLKANLVMAKKPEAAATTHPIFIKAIADILIEENNNVVIVGDSPGGLFNMKALDKVYRECGYYDVFRDSKVQLNMNFESKNIKFDDGKLLKNLTIVDELSRVDKVISVSKLKTHGMMKFTGAVKNMFGVIPGILKAEFHLRMPKVDDFADMLVDVCLSSKPVLSFMDGIRGMEGAGPTSGVVVDSNIILVSDSPYSLDYVATKIIKMDSTSVPTVMKSIERGLIHSEFEKINILGQNLNEFNVKEFDSPEILKIDFLNNFLPEIISSKLNNILKPRPVFNLEKCIKCRACYDACPPKTIEMLEKQYPKLKIDDCISCFCCQELCPVGAIDIKRPWIIDKILKK